MRKPHGYWTKERCKEDALNYKTRTEWSKSLSAYDCAKKNGWVDECCSHMEYIQLPNDYWTLEKCKEEALKYECRKTWRKHSNASYSASKKKKWYEECCSHMKYIHKPNGYWTLEKCKEEALKYIYKKDFEKYSSTAYNKYLSNGWDICNHMKQSGSTHLRHVYVYEFDDMSAYVGLTYNIENRNSRHLSDVRSQVYKHINITQNYILKVLTEVPLSTEDAQLLEHETKNKYINNGWYILNKGKTGKGIGSLGGNIIKWTKERCHEEALKYKTRKEFEVKSPSAYTISGKYGWKNDICSHMN